MEVVVLHRVGFSAYFCPKQGQDFKPSAAPLYPNIGQVPPPGPTCNRTLPARKNGREGTSPVFPRGEGTATRRLAEMHS